MSHRSFSYKLSNQIAEESQLLAEEKWLIDALTKIKNQRNCLQIERLHLESMKANLDQQSDGPLEETDETSLETPAHMKPAPIMFSSRNSIVFEEPLDNEANCNDEELDLIVTKSYFSQDENEDSDSEEYDEDDCDDVIIDMNMLMNGDID